ncbi:hypothetical protein HDV01_007701 [Terramyces sp. JEL0728]|nr:hypothetical protein HDV01_007701 [Terramyces sp. JEL0728]
MMKIVYLFILFWIGYFLFYFFDSSIVIENVEIPSLLTHFKEQKEQLGNATIRESQFPLGKVQNYYRNITGSMYGTVLDQPLAIHISTNRTFRDYYFVRGETDIGADSYFVYGIQYVNTSTVYLHTSFKEWDLNFTLLSLPITNNETKQMLLQINQVYIDKLERDLQSDLKIKKQVIKKNHMNCEFDIYMQMEPLSATQGEIIDFEQEMELSVGVEVIEPLPLQANVNFTSRDCNISWGTTVMGIRQDVLFQKSRKIFVILFAVILVELYVTAIEIEVTSSQSARSKLSSVTIGLMAFTDLFICLLNSAYAFAYDNMLLLPTNYTFGVLLTVFVVLQVWLMLLPSPMAIRKLIPASWLPVVYDYHPKLDQGDLESLLPQNALHNTECAICFGMIELDDTDPMEVMVTPCNHLYHSHCLEQWMEVRLEVIKS